MKTLAVIQMILGLAIAGACAYILGHAFPTTFELPPIGDIRHTVVIDWAKPPTAFLMAIVALGLGLAVFGISRAQYLKARKL